MVKKVALTLGALALAFGGAALIAPAAHADSSASTTGAKATFTSDGEIFRLYDTKCDGNPVYLVYKLRGGSEQRMDFSGGCNNSGSFNKDFYENSKIEYKACVNIDNASDRCSGWTTDET